MAITADKLRSTVLSGHSLTTQSLLNLLRRQQIDVHPSEIYRLAVTANIRMQADETWMALDAEETGLKQLLLNTKQERNET